MEIKIGKKFHELKLYIKLYENIIFDIFTSIFTFIANSL